MRGGASDAVLQIGYSEKSIGGAERSESACAPKVPSGPAKTGRPLTACSRRRRLTADERFLFSAHEQGPCGAMAPAGAQTHRVCAFPFGAR